MFDGFLKLGEVELVNSSRSKGYATSAECPLSWFDYDCDGLEDALLASGQYQWANISAAPWYDPRNPESARFYGAFGLGMRNIYDSTLFAEVTEGITDGGVVGAARRAGRSVRVRAWLSASGEDALEYGMAWLSSALSGSVCAQHGTTCGGASAQFFVACPPAREVGESDDDYLPGIVALERYLHGVSVVSGPLEIASERSNDGIHWGREVEFTLYAERPGIFGAPRALNLPPTVPTVAQDVPYNLAPYPSAELSSGTVIVAENLSTNPSVESNATGWTATGAAVSGSAPSIAGSRSTELAASGSASFLATATGAGTAVHDVIAYQDVTVAPAAGSRYSLTIWGAMLFTGSGGSGVSLGAKVEWRNSGGTVLRTDSMGSITSAFAGQVFALKSVAPPSGAVTARVILTGRANFTASTVAKVFGDALAVTVP